MEGLFRADAIDNRCGLLGHFSEPLLGEFTNHCSGASQDMLWLAFSSEASHDTERKIIPGRELCLVCYPLERRSKAIPALVVDSAADRISADQGDAKPQGFPVLPASPIRDRNLGWTT